VDLHRGGNGIDRPPGSAAAFAALRPRCLAASLPRGLEQAPGGLTDEYSLTGSP
jgi:hypothetical protein